MAQRPDPHCTGDETRCQLCDMVRQIFDGFPKEENPGCETAQGSKADKQHRIMHAESQHWMKGHPK